MSDWTIKHLTEQLNAVCKSRNKNRAAQIEKILCRAYDTGKEDAKEEIRLSLGITPCDCRNHVPYD
jgi:hypothetical protein